MESGGQGQQEHNGGGCEVSPQEKTEEGRGQTGKRVRGTREKGKEVQNGRDQRAKKGEPRA